MPNSQPSAESMNEALIRLKPELSQIKKEDLRAIRVKHHRAWELATKLHQDFAPLLLEAEQQFSDARYAEVRHAYDNLLGYARSYYASELQLESFKTGQISNESKILHERIRFYDDLLSYWAPPFFQRNPKAAPALKRFLSQRGRRDSADDVLGLAALFERYWPDLVEQGWSVGLIKVGISPETLLTMSFDATKWLEMWAKRSNTQECRVLRAQAYTALYHAYDVLHQAGTFLRPKQNWAKLAPKRVVKRTKTKSETPSEQAPPA